MKTNSYKLKDVIMMAILGVLFAAIGFAALEVGANSMQRQMGVPSAIVNILVGLIVLLILGRELFNRKRKGEKPC